MSGIYIKGMEMPKPGRYEAVIIVLDKSTAEIAISPAEDDIGYWKEYPLVPVPEHGRLGDLDELFKRMFIGPDGQCYPDKDVDGWDHAYTFRGIKHEILSASTIIPADKEVDNGT